MNDEKVQNLKRIESSNKPDVDIEGLKKDFKNGFDIPFIKDRIQHESYDEEEKCQEAIWNFFEKHLKPTSKRDAAEKKTIGKIEYDAITSFVAWVVVNKNDLEIAHDLDEYAKIYYENYLNSDGGKEQE